MRSILVIGDSSNAGTALMKVTAEELFLPPITSSELRTIQESKIPDFIARQLKTQFADFTEVVVFYCIGVVNVDRHNFEQALFFNSQLPLKLLEIIDDLKCKLVTFGSIMESQKQMVDSNLYLNSKHNFYKQIQGLSLTSLLHIQYHTWYGGRKLHSGMFLSEIIKCLIKEEIFKMSSGLQFREYHHIEDDMKILLQNLDLQGVQAMTFENAIQLKDLASEIFSHFGYEELLEIDSGLNVSNEVYEKFAVSEEMRSRISNCSFRPLFPSIFAYCSDLLKIGRVL